MKPAPFSPSLHALRLALGTGLPLLAGVLTGNPGPYLYVALGALLTEPSTRLGAYRERFRISAISTAIGMIGCLIGPVIAGHGPVSLAVLILIGFVSGIISGYGAAFSTGALNMLVLAIVHTYAAGHMPPWMVALCFAAGAAFVNALLALEALGDRSKPERRLRAELLRALAALARAEGATASEEARRAVTEKIKSAYDMLIEKRSHNAGRTRELARSADLLSLANQLTISIIAARKHNRDCADVAIMLESMAAAHEAGNPTPPAIGKDEGELYRLCRQLSDRLWHPLDAASQERVAVRPHRPFSRAALSARLRRLVVGREVFTAAVRLALCIAIAEAAGRIVSGDHAYWLPVTVAIIMKPDFGSVFTRAIHRSIGTVIGVLIAMSVLLLVHADLGLVAAVAVLAAADPYASLRSYAAKVTFLTPLILIMIEIAAPGPPLHYAMQRLVDTLIGAAVVLVFGYLIWPRSQTVRLRTTFDDAMETVNGYLTAASSAAPNLGEREFAAYRKLSDLRTQLQKLNAEPPPAGREAAAWFPAVVGAERLCDVISAYAEDRRLGDPPPDAQRLERATRALGNLGRGEPGTGAAENPDRFSAVEAEIAWLSGYLRDLSSAAASAPGSPALR